MMHGLRSSDDRLPGRVPLTLSVTLILVLAGVAGALITANHALVALGFFLLALGIGAVMVFGYVRSFRARNGYPHAAEVWVSMTARRIAIVSQLLIALVLITLVIIAIRR